MNEYRVRRARPIAAEMRVPGDLHLSHRAVLFAGLANGPSIITGFLPAVECLATIQACRALGVKVDYLSAADSDLPWTPDEKGGPPGPVRLRVHGMALRLREPAGAVDCGGSGTALMLLCGMLAGQRFATKLIADESVSRLSLRRLLAPLEMMGVTVNATGPDKTAPVTVSTPASLQAAVHSLPVTGAETKDALLLAGLFAGGRTTIRTSAPDHLEQMLRHWQVRTLRRDGAVSIHGGQMPESRDFQVPGDISLAAHWITAAAAQPGSELTVRGCAAAAVIQ